MLRIKIEFFRAVVPCILVERYLGKCNNMPQNGTLKVFILFCSLGCSISSAGRPAYNLSYWHGLAQLVSALQLNCVSGIPIKS